MEFLNIVLSLLPALKLVMQHLAYPFKAHGNVKDLKRTTEHLLAKRKDVKELIEIAERNGQRPTHQSQRWLAEVEASKDEVDKMVEKYNKSCSCFNCFSPSSYSNYTISKTATKKLLDVQRLLNDGTTIAPLKIAITPVPPPVQEVPIPTTSKSLLDANPNLEQALCYIKDNQKVGMIGIWGMGGVGKSHLLRQINNSFIGDPSFDHVILTIASQSYTTRKLQKEIAMKLNLHKHEDVSEQEQGEVIFNFLNKRSFLLLLDDLWEGIDLQKIGIPFPLGVVGGCKRKVVLTTRLINVCGQMEVRKKIKVECLKYEDACNLFLEKVGEETINSHPRILSLAEDIVKELDGLPLALITTGRAMYEKKDPREWEYTINLLRKSRLNEVEHSCDNQKESTFHTLKFSYDSLKSDTLRECFLSCSMWPTDHLLVKDGLIKCWMGLGLIKDFDNMSEAYHIGYNLIGMLIGACLLEQDHEDDLAVRMHDILHDMALWLVSDNGKNKNKWIVHEGEGQYDKEIWHEAEMISLENSNIREMPPIASAPYSSKLTTLRLPGNTDLKVIRDFRAFVALTFLDLSWCGLVHFPLEICGLTQLRYLNLARNDRIQSLPREVRSLVNLKFLILRDTGIYEIPKGVIWKLKSLHVLDLYRSRSHEQGNSTYSPSLLLEELGCLNNLKGLGICVQSISQLNQSIELSNASVMSLNISSPQKSALFSLSARFLRNQKIQTNLVDLCFMNSHVSQLVIEGDHQHPSGHLRALEFLRFDNMHSLEGIIWKGVSPKELFQALRFLYIVGCEMLENISWILHLQCLSHLRVLKCSNMRHLIASEADNHSISTFCSLTDIKLSSLQELISICHPMFTFPALNYIKISGCSKLKKLPFRAKNIPNRLKFLHCEKEWLDNLEWEDDIARTSLQHLVEHF